MGGLTRRANHGPRMPLFRCGIVPWLYKALHRLIPFPNGVVARIPHPGRKVVCECAWPNPLLSNHVAPTLPFASWFESPRALAIGRVDWVVLRIRTTARATPSGRAMESFFPLPVPLVDAGYHLCLLPCSSSPANGILGFVVVGCTVH